MKKFAYLLIILLFTSCGSVDVEQLRQYPAWLANVNGKSWVVRIDDVTSDQVTGRAYLADKLVAAKHPFTATIKNGRCVFSMPGVTEDVTVKLKMKGDCVTCRSNDLEVRSFTLKPIEMKTFKSFRDQFVSPIYKVKVSKNVTYARAEGYWSSYPDVDESFAKIYARRVPDLLSGPQSLDLKMDIYLPDDNKDGLRPLMFLIHGGAFYNGDKQDEPIVKWCRHYASLGYVVVSPNYRMGFKPNHESIDKAGYHATQDVHAAVRYMLHHASEYRINPDWLFLGGSSAGAITALNVTFLRDKNRPGTVLDEGPISKLATAYKEKIKVRGVANMWGAVTDTLILANSPTTAIISFHGDADNIVPYGHDYPFKNIVGPGGEIAKSLRKLFPSNDQKSGKAQDELIAKMYGSQCIDQYARNHGMRSRLFTKRGAGHSLHVDEHRKISSYFYTIQDSVACFFYRELVPQPVSLRHVSKNSMTYTFDKSQVSEIYWQVKGGVLLEESADEIRVIFFGDEKKHGLMVSGKYKNGIEFKQSINL